MGLGLVKFREATVLHVIELTEQMSALTAALLHFPFKSVHLLLKLRHSFVCTLHQKNI
jgi:hypothetical protein